MSGRRSVVSPRTSPAPETRGSACRIQPATLARDVGLERERGWRSRCAPPGRRACHSPRPSGRASPRPAARASRPSRRARRASPMKGSESTIISRPTVVRMRLGEHQRDQPAHRMTDHAGRAEFLRGEIAVRDRRRSPSSRPGFRLSRGRVAAEAVDLDQIDAVVARERRARRRPTPRAGREAGDQDRPGVPCARASVTEMCGSAVAAGCDRRRGGRRCACAAWMRRAAAWRRGGKTGGACGSWSVLLGRADEDVFDRELEQLGDPEGERERRVVAAGLDRVDALARDLEPLGEVAAGSSRARRAGRAGGWSCRPPPSVSLLTQAPSPRPANQTTADNRRRHVAPGRSSRGTPRPSRG